MDDSKKLTISDIADALKVSKTTVSRALSGKGRISEETRRRVLEYASVRDYTPNVIARSLAQSKTFNLAMLLPADCNVSEMPFFQHCMYGVCAAAAERDYDVLAVYAVGDETSGLERILANNKVDGVILSRTVVDDKLIKLVKKKGLPIIAIGSTEDEGIHRVDHDHRSACREMTQNLIKSGIKRIGLIGGSNMHIVTRTRYLGFTDAFREAGRKLDSDLIYLNVEDLNTLNSIIDELIRKGAECIVCMDDMLCGRVIQTLQKGNIHIPGDIKVASFYNSSLLDMQVPAVSTLEFDVLELGKTACNVLLDAIDGKEVAQTTLLPYRVDMKESTR